MVSILAVTRSKRATRAARDFQAIYTDALDRTPYFAAPTRPEALLAIRESRSGGGRAVDLGAGEGRYSILLASQGFQTVAVDVCAVGFSRLQGIENISTMEGDVTDVSLNVEPADVVIASTVLDHVARRSALVAGDVLDRYMKRGAAAYVSVFTTADPAYAGMNSLASETGHLVINFFEPDQLREELSNLEVLAYSETVEIDRSHGPTHSHGLARAVVRKQ